MFEDKKERGYKKPPDKPPDGISSVFPLSTIL